MKQFIADLNEWLCTTEVTEETTMDTLDYLFRTIDERVIANANDENAHKDYVDSIEPYYPTKIA